MTDYAKLGFKAGLEIHQQLSGKKLFCHCLTLNTDKEADAKATRKLRAVVGETGQIDAAAAHESSKSKTFTYQGSRTDCCLIEFDEEPPMPLNKQALHSALQISLLLSATPVDEIHIMRKTVVDGSNVSGFQRTALVAMDGSITTSKGTVKIDSICLEEEAAQKLSSDDKQATYKLDRLGIPLVEIATDASIQDPEHAKEVAAHIGMVLRSVQGVKRGLGTIRQDVNVSITGGNRVEIKGFQELKSIPKVVTNEIARQQDLIGQNKEVAKEVRKAEPDFSTSFLRPMPGAARLYPETDCIPTAISEKMLEGIELPELVGDKIARFEKEYKLPHDLAVDAAQFDGFSDLVTSYDNVSPMIIAQTLFSIPKDLKTRLKLDVTKLDSKVYNEILGYVQEGKVSKGAIADLLTKKIKGETIDLSAFETMSEEQAEQEIQAIIDSKPGLNVGGYMGIVMGKLKGKVEGKQAMMILKKLVK